MKLKNYFQFIGFFNYLMGVSLIANGPVGVDDWSFDIPSPHFQTFSSEIQEPVAVSVDLDKNEGLQKPLSFEAELADVDPFLSIASDSLMVALAQALENRYGFEGMLDIQLLSPVLIPKIKGDYWQLNLIESPKNMASRMSLVFNIKSTSESFGPFRVLVQAQCWQDVYFTKDRILTRKALSPYDFDTHKVDILSYGQSIVAAHIDLKDYELLHTLSAHKPLMWRDITRKPTIRKGKMVNAVGRNGLLTLSMKCEAVTNGFEGEFVTLRNLQTRKEFQGRVQNQETVEIYF